MKRHGVGNFAPEVTPGLDLESPTNKVYGGGQGVSLAGAPPNIQPYQGIGSKGSKSAGGGLANAEGMKKVAMIAGVVWVGGWFLGYGIAWPLLLVLDALQTVLSIPPFSWLFGWLWTPLSWIFGFMYRGAPIVDQVGALQELRLPADQVSVYLDSYSQQYGDAALIFAAHDGYPQLVNGLLYSKELGYSDLLDATDDNGNTALIYAAAKGYKQCIAALLRHGADPDVANQGGGGRTPLMEAAGAGHKDVVAAMRLSNATMDLTDDYGNTALHYAAYHGHLSVVHELLKGNPRRDLKNSYGHTAASYATSNNFKAIADVINRGPPRSQRKEAEKEDEHVDFMEKLEQELKKQKAEKRVKGAAEELHKEEKDFAPKVEKLVNGVTDDERKSLEDQVAKLRRQHEEAELKAQKRIVELLEKSHDQQKSVDEARREAQELVLNNTELQMKVQEYRSKHRSSELRASDERDRAERLQDELRRLELEADQHKSKADNAERERDLHVDASRRHEESLRRKHEEINDHVTRLERQSNEMKALRDDILRREQEVWKHKQRVAELEREVRNGAWVSSAPAAAENKPPPVSTASATPPQGLPTASEAAPSTDKPVVGENGPAERNMEAAASSPSMAVDERSADASKPDDVAPAATQAAANSPSVAVDEQRADASKPDDVAPAATQEGSAVATDKLET